MRAAIVTGIVAQTVALILHWYTDLSFGVEMVCKDRTQKMAKNPLKCSNAEEGP